MKSFGRLSLKQFLIPVLICSWALLGVAAMANSADRPRAPIEFEVDQNAWAMRSGAPVPLRLKITCSSSGIMEGNLEIQVNDNTGDTIGLFMIPDLVYSPGRQEVEYLLPIQSHRMSNSLGITCFFREKNGPVYSNTGMLILPGRRSFVVPIVHGLEPGDGSTDDFAWLMLENHCPKHSINATVTPMLTITPRIRGADLPRDPLKHLPHDIVVVEAGGYTELVAAQIQALEAWVKGGGSLFLQIGDAELSVEQQAFIDRLIAKNPNVLTDEIEGTNLIPVITGGTAHLLEYGIGQVCLTTARSWSKVQDADRLLVLEFLWRLRADHHQSLVSSGQLSLLPAKNEQLSQWNQYPNSGGQRVYPPGNYPVDSPLAALENDEILVRWGQLLLEPRSPRPNEMIEALMPQDVQAVPVWLLAGIILAYIVAIGYGDYTILGKLKRRRWTWFTFPAVSLAVSLLCFGTAKGYLGTSQELSAVEFRDVADDGTICRTQRFELLFRSSSGQSQTILDNVAFTPVARQQVGTQNYQGLPTALESQLIVIQGNPTAQATASQQIEQWKPQLNRTVSFPRDQKVSLALPALAPGASVSSPEYEKELDTRIREVWPDTVGHLFYSQDGMVGGNMNSLINNVEGMRLMQLMSNCRAVSINQANQGASGLFTLFNQISPSADIGLADMVIATPGHHVLCVGVREAVNELVIYRWRLPSQ